MFGELDASVVRYRTGNPGDANPKLHGPAHDLGGGSTDVDAAIQWMIDQVRGCTDCSAKLDIVVLRSSGADGYNDYIYAMNGVDSVETLVITNRKDANRPDMESTVKNAEIIFFAGGDQCNYVKNFKRTKIQKAVESVYQRGGGIGGTSAGEAILGEYVFDACKDTVISTDALSNPYHHTISFTYDFLRFANLQNTITDQHFVARDRMGRLLGFLARQIQDGKTSSVWGVAVNEKTSLTIDQNGQARVMGEGPAYFILADHPPEQCVPNKPLTFSNYKFWKVQAGGNFDLKKRPIDGYYLRSVTNGKINSNPY
jgi:cyanophycinase